MATMSSGVNLGGAAPRRRTPPPAQPPLQVHREKAVLGVDEPLREGEVVVVRRGDVGDAVRVPGDLDGGRQAGDGKGAFPLRHARLGEGRTGGQPKRGGGEKAAAPPEERAGGGG